MNRRGILKLIGMAPIAGPEAAKELAAQKMGLVKGLGRRDMGAGLMGSMNVASPIPQVDDSSMLQFELRHAMESLAELDDKSKRQRVRDETAMHGARVLGPNLAALRSVSPAAALQIQIDHDVEKSFKAQKGWLETRIAELKKKLGPLSVMLS